MLEKYERFTDEICDMVLDCVQAFPLRLSLYASITAICISKNPQFREDIAEKLLDRIQGSIKAHNLTFFTNLIKFSTHLTNMGLFRVASVFKLYHKILKLKGETYLSLFLNSLLLLKDFTVHGNSEPLQQEDSEELNRFKDLLHSVYHLSIKTHKQKVTDLFSLHIGFRSEKSKIQNKGRPTLSSIIDHDVDESVQVAFQTSYSEDLFHLVTNLLSNLVEKSRNSDNSIDIEGIERCFYLRAKKMREFLKEVNFSEAVIEERLLDVNLEESLAERDTEMIGTSSVDSTASFLELIPFLNKVEIFSPANERYSEKVRRGRSQEEFPLQGIEIGALNYEKIGLVEFYAMTDLIVTLFDSYPHMSRRLSFEVLAVFHNNSDLYNLIEVLFNLAYYQKKRRLQVLSFICQLAFTTISKDTRNNDPEETKEREMRVDSDDRVSILTVLDDFIDGFVINLPSYDHSVVLFATDFLSFLINQIYVSSNANYTVFVTTKFKNMKKFSWNRWSSLVNIKPVKGSAAEKRKDFISSLLHKMKSMSYDEGFMKLIGEDFDSIFDTTTNIKAEDSQEVEGDELYQKLVQFIKSKPTVEAQLKFIEDSAVKEELSKDKEQSIKIVGKVILLFHKSLSHLNIAVERLYQVIKFLLQNSASLITFIDFVKTEMRKDKSNGETNVKFFLISLVYNLQIVSGKDICSYLLLSNEYELLRLFLSHEKETKQEIDYDQLKKKLSEVQEEEKQKIKSLFHSVA